MDETGVAPSPMPAELLEADDEIDIEGDDDVPVLHHEARFLPHKPEPPLTRTLRCVSVIVCT